VPVFKGLARSHQQQARGIARLGRVQGDQFFGQVEVEFGNTHVGSLA
jgi:hypothetical protein